jgi:metal-dependent HD superfamily phosphatase/phosphodiesterase
VSTIGNINRLIHAVAGHDGQHRTKHSVCGIVISDQILPKIFGSTKYPYAKVDGKAPPT